MLQATKAKTKRKPPKEKLVLCVRIGIRNQIKITKFAFLFPGEKNKKFVAMANAEYENIAKTTPLVKKELSLKKTDNVGEIKKRPFLCY